ncbi:hypothetical protein [Ornithinimicrobium kibberense]|uniref:hypothetical protein n=1 Tax=Ornithinimicrobium kibberense TaxID=282060 RepID=UPI0036149DED
MPRSPRRCSGWRCPGRTAPGVPSWPSCTGACRPRSRPRAGPSRRCGTTTPTAPPSSWTACWGAGARPTRPWSCARS